MLMVLQMEDILILDGKSAFHRSVSVFFFLVFFAMVKINLQLSDHKSC